MPKKKRKQGGTYRVPPVEHRFKPGVSGNPQGSRLHNPIKKALANLTAESYCEVIKLVCEGNVDELQAMEDDPKTSALQVGIARAFRKALLAGDYDVIERIASRIVGTPPKEFIVKSQNQNLNATVTAVDAAAVKEIVGKLESDV